MIITTLTGGLGNQLFQYAFGRSLALRSGQKLYLETESYKADYLSRKFLLSHYRIQSQVIPSLVQKRVLTDRTKVNNILKRFHLIDTYRETDFSFKPQFCTPRSYINYYIGFWQSYRYFQDIRGVLLGEFTCATENLDAVKRKVWTGPSHISIHVRRKDYLNDDRYGFVGEAYYRQALQHLQEKGVSGHYLIFSDDIDWCKSFFSDLQGTTFIGPEYRLEDYEELQLMAACDHHIIANSSFSWWGAWLGTNPTQQVLRPRNPFREPSLFYQHHYPEHWTVIDN